jgi:hypothetical protein
VRRHDWYGKYWTKWSDALREAGLAPNQLTVAIPEEELLVHLASLTRELGHVPIEADLRMKARAVPSFPSHATFARLGRKAQLIVKLHQFCLDHGYADVAERCVPLLVDDKPDLDVSDNGRGTVAPGYVYLVRHGSRREFKIGKTNNRLRREGEITVELPQELHPIHVIETDDPSGIENYWHRRFGEKRLKNEWFALTPDDVRAFKRWRKVY